MLADPARAAADAPDLASTATAQVHRPRPRTSHGRSSGERPLTAAEIALLRSQARLRRADRRGLDSSRHDQRLLEHTSQGRSPGYSVNAELLLMLTSVSDTQRSTGWAVST